MEDPGLQFAEAVDGLTVVVVHRGTQKPQRIDVIEN
jgi:hypothetical protein